MGSQYEAFPKILISAAGYVLILVMFILAALGVLWMSCMSSVRQKVVKTTRDLPAYTFIRPDDLVESDGLALSTDAVTTSSAALGRLTTRPLQRETALASSALLENAHVQQGWLLFTLPLSGTPIPGVGETMSLLGQEEHACKIRVISEMAVTVGVEDQKIVVALPPAEALLAATYLLADKHLLLLRRLPGGRQPLVDLIPDLGCLSDKGKTLTETASILSQKPVLSPPGTKNPVKR